MAKWNFSFPPNYKMVVTFFSCVLLKLSPLPMLETVFFQLWCTVHWHQKYKGITELEMGPQNLHIWTSDSSLEESLRLLFWRLEAPLFTLRLLVISIYPLPPSLLGQQGLQERIGVTLWHPPGISQDWDCFCESTTRFALTVRTQGGAPPCQCKYWSWGLAQHS